jgi:protein arginine kinase
MNSNSTLAKDFDFINLDNTPLDEKERLREEHLISPQMVDGKGKSVLINHDRTMSIMLMEEDHIRLQIIEGGNKLLEAYETASKVDDVLEESLTYAFDDDFGYLTACPTNTGTGMRASLMLHLPALTMTDNIGRILSSVSNMGTAVRGLYGEGTRAYGNLYQISNQVTMGVSEREIIEKLNNVVKQIAEAEEKTRKALADKNGDYLKNKIMRSYGLLKYAYTMESSEARELLSDVILGQNMGILQKGKVSPLECMINATPSFIGGSNPAERDRKRAAYLNENV